MTDGNALNWDYVSGLFDGEGTIGLDFRDTRTLVVTISIAQKYRPILEDVHDFLRLNGIGSRVTTRSHGTSYVGIGRIHDVLRFLSNLRAFIKSAQVSAAINYLEGRITGNHFLQILRHEEEAGKRRKSTHRGKDDFPHTTSKARQLAQQERVKAAISAMHEQRIINLRKRFTLLPSQFDLDGVARLLGLSKVRASQIVRYMRSRGWVSCKVYKTNVSRPRLICKKIEG